MLHSDKITVRKIIPLNTLLVEKLSIRLTKDGQSLQIENMFDDVNRCDLD